MRKITIWLMGTVSGLVLLFSYHTSLGGDGGGGGPTTIADPAGLPRAGAASPTDPAPSRDPGQGADAGQPSDGGQAAAGDPSSLSGAPPTTAAADQGVSGTFTGQTADTRWGPVQVRIVVRNSKITNATAVQFPTGNHRDQEINAWAVPQLQQATVASNGNGFDTLSGATVTSTGYKESLQSALDQAHL